MTRTFIFLVLAALATCLVGVPVLFAVVDDDDAPVHRRKTASGNDRDADKGAASFGWLRALARAADEPETVVDEAPQVGGDLERLDGLLEDGVARCAPEIFGYDRKLLTALQPDWRPMKPNLLPSWDAWLKIGGIVVDQDRLQACNDAFAKNDCAAMQNVWELCTAPFKGTLGEGERCTSNDQCVSGGCTNFACDRPNDCNGPASCPAGMLCASDETGFATCVEAPTDGAPCLEGAVEEPPRGLAGMAGAMADAIPSRHGAVGIDPRCGPGRSCDENSQCFPARGEGRSCGPGQPCTIDLFCDEDSGGQPVCRRDTEPNPDENAEVNPDDAVNVVDDEPMNEGCACDPMRDGKACVDDAEGNTKCVPVQIVERGDTCDPVHLCRGSLGITACIDGRCQDALSAGDACGDHDECKDDLVCIAGACAAPLHAGQECSDGDQCIFGLSCLDGVGAMTCAVPQQMNSGDVDGAMDGMDNGPGSDTGSGTGIIQLGDTIIESNDFEGSDSADDTALAVPAGENVDLPPDMLEREYKLRAELIID